VGRAALRQSPCASRDCRQGPPLMAVPQETLSDLPLLEQAAGWFDRVSSGSLSPDDTETFERWRSNPDHALAYAEVEAVHAEAKSMANAPDMLALRHEALSRIVLPE